MACRNVLLPLVLFVGLITPAVSVAADEAAATGIDALRAAWEQAPRDLLGGIALQDALCEAGREREARSLFRRATYQHRGDVAVAFLYGRVQGGREGVELMRRSLTDEKSDAADSDEARRAAWRSLRDAEIALGRWTDAEDSARKVIELDPAADDWAALGRILHRGGAGDEAMKAYAQAIRLQSNHLSARNSLALLQARTGETEAAADLARATVELFPKIASAHLHLGLILCLGGDREGGREAYAAALRCAAGDADALAAVASAYTDLEEHDLARAALEQSLALQKGNAHALIGSGVLALERGETAEARRLLDRAAKLRPDDARVAFLQGVCHQRLGHKSLAVSAFKRASRLDPTSLDYLTALALALDRKGATDTAISTMKKAVRLAPDVAAVHLQLGLLQFRKRRYRDALSALRKASDLAPTDPSALFYIAIIQGDRMGKLDDALRSLRLYRDLGGNDPSALAWLEEIEAAR